MINILITGKNGYIAKNTKKWLSQWPDKYNVDLISLRDDSWKNVDFSKYDVLLHAAAIVHRKEKPQMKDIYFKINRDLVIEVVKKAKKEGIKQFIFMSSMSVYGLEGKVGKDVVITKDTICKPKSFYGKSKLEAEKELQKMEDKNFCVAIIRAPMVYGPNSPGNYMRLFKFVMKTPIFPLINNTRSMIYIDNLTEFIRLVIDNSDSGLFFPQNKEYVNTVGLVKLIAKKNNKKVYLSKILAFGLKIFGCTNIVKKVFGNFVYDLELSAYRDFEYCVVDLNKSIKSCQKNNKKRC